MNTMEMTLDKTKLEAQELHVKIMAQGQVLATALLEFAKNLKEMRDKRLYQSLGYATYEEYVEQAVGIRQRQAYNYISTYERLGPKYMEQNAGLGISKLQLLAELPAMDRDGFTEDNDLANMSVAEIKEAIKQANDRGQQLSMLETELQDAQSSEQTYKREMERLQAKTKELEAQLKAEKNKRPEPIKVPAEPDAELIAEIREQAMEEAKRQTQEQIEQAERRAKQEAMQEAQKAMQQQIQTQQEQTAQAEQRAQQLAKRLEMESDRQTIRFGMLFEQLQTVADEMEGVLEEMQAEGKGEKAEKLRTAFKGALLQMMEG